MLGDDLIKLLEAASRSVAERAERDAEVKAALSRIGRWLIDLANRLPEHDGHATGPVEPSAISSRVDGQSAEQRTDSVDAAHDTGGGAVTGASLADQIESRPLERLTSPAQPTITGPRVVSMPLPPPRSLDLGVIVRRSRLKAEACRWAITRRRRLAEGADFKTAISPTDHEMIDRAKELPQCYLWMLDPYGVMPPDDPVLSMIDACYTNLADAAVLVQQVQRKQEENGGDASSSPSIEEPVRLLAEAQSALRVALTEAALRADFDQIDAFAWLKEFTYAERIYLDRFMRLDNAADPRDWSDLHDRIERLRDESDETSARATRRTKLLNRARYHIRKLDDGDLNDWRKIMAAIDDLVDAGVPPSDLEIRELLLPVLDEIPDEIELAPGKGAAQAVREVDRYLASREASREAAPPVRERELTDEVRRVASLLRGKTIVLIGGDERAEASRAIERAFELEQLRWVSAKPHQSTTTFEPEVARDETALVMLAIRFSSHSFEGVKAMCERYGKPFVRLPGGYGVNQIARQILAQVGNRLASG